MINNHIIEKYIEKVFKEKGIPKHVNISEDEFIGVLWFLIGEQKEVNSFVSPQDLLDLIRKIVKIKMEDK